MHEFYVNAMRAISPELIEHLALTGRDISFTHENGPRRLRGRDPRATGGAPGVGAGSVPRRGVATARLPTHDVEGVPEGHVPSTDLEFTPIRCKRNRGGMRCRGSGFRGRDNRPRVAARIRRCRDETAGAGARVLAAGRRHRDSRSDPQRISQVPGPSATTDLDRQGHSAKPDFAAIQRS